MPSFADILKGLSAVGQIGVSVAAYESGRRAEAQQQAARAARGAASKLPAVKPKASCCLKRAAQHGGLKWRSGS